MQAREITPANLEGVGGKGGAAVAAVFQEWEGEGVAGAVAVGLTQVSR